MVRNSEHKLMAWDGEQMPIESWSEMRNSSYAPRCKEYEEHKLGGLEHKLGGLDSYFFILFFETIEDN